MRLRKELNPAEFILFPCLFTDYQAATFPYVGDGPVYNSYRYVAGKAPGMASELVQIKYSKHWLIDTLCAGLRASILSFEALHSCKVASSSQLLSGRSLEEACCKCFWGCLGCSFASLGRRWKPGDDRHFVEYRASCHQCSLFHR